MLKAKHVLLVDDSSTIRMFLRAVLTQQGAMVQEAEFGEEAMHLLQITDPPCLLYTSRCV